MFSRIVEMSPVWLVGGLRKFRSLATGIAATLLIAAATDVCVAQDWMFRRSYYSHDRQPGDEWIYTEPVSRSAYRRAYVSEGPGFAVRGGWRYNTTLLRSGSSIDVTVQREGWFEVAP